LRFDNFLSALAFSVFFALSSLLSSTAEATNLCHPFSAFKKKLGRCEDNYIVADEALNCLGYYYKHVEAGKLRVKKVFDEQIKKMKDKQSDSFDRTDEGYERARKEIQNLIADGVLARAVVDSYYAEMYFPEDYNMPSVTGMSTEKYLASEECFANPKLVLTKTQVMIDTIVNDLKAIDLSSSKKEAKSQTRSKNVQVLTPSSVSNTKAQGAAVSPKVPAGTSPKSASDISGAKKAIEDAAKAKALVNQPPQK